MYKENTAIDKMKRKFFLFSIVGVGFIILASVLALVYYERAISSHRSIQKFYTDLAAQLTLVNDISLMIEEFTGSPTSSKFSDIEPKVKSAILKLKRTNEDFKKVMARVDSKSFDELESVVEDKKYNQTLENFFASSRDIFEVDRQGGFDKLKRRLKRVIDISRNRLITAHGLISRRAEKEQTQSLERLKRVGYVFASIFFLQVLGMWLFIFRPLYRQLLSQNDKLFNAIIESKSANRSKTEFLANISHEIRTPMTAILGYADLLKKDQGSQTEQEKSVDVINRNAMHLLSLLDEILDISKIEAGKFDLNIEPVNLPEVLDSVFELVKVKAEEKGIDLRLETVTALPEFIDTDPKRLKQILINLVGNAIKFTNEGSVTISPSYNKKKNKLIIKIVDTGVGISREDVKKLFQPFSQGDSSTNRHHGGTGLGLVLSRGLARSMNGDIKILESRVNKGTTFALTLDAGDSASRNLVYTLDQKPSGSPNEAMQAVSLSGRTVLVVDDAVENARLFCIYLAKAGAQVEVANGGKEALRKNQNHDFDLVLLDLQMPGMDGFQTIKALRANGFNKPILALTAHAMQDEKERCHKAGFNDHITKPVSSEVLVQSVFSNLNV